LRSWEANLESEYLSSERCSSLNDANEYFNPMMMPIISSFMNSSFRIKIALTSPHISQYHPESEVVLLPEAFLVGSEAKISLLWPKGHKLEGDNGWMCLPSVKLTWLAGISPFLNRKLIFKGAPFFPFAML